MPTHRPRIPALAALAAALLAPAMAPMLPGALAFFDGRFDGYEVTEIAFEMVGLDAPEVLILPDDGMTEALELGFSARWFDDPVSRFWVGSNGFISVFKKEQAGCCEGQALPDPSDPDGLVAGFWTDLDPGAGGEVSQQRFASLARPGLAPMKAAVASWRDVPGPGGMRNTFQVVFLEDGTADIVVSEAHVPSGVNATIGGEDFNGSAAALVLRGEAFDLSQRAWRLAPRYTPLVPDLVLDRLEVSRPLQPDLPWTVTVHLRNAGAGPITQARIALTALPMTGPLRGASPGCPELVGTKSVYDIKPGEALEVAFTWPAPVSVSAPAVPRVGEYRFDAAGTVLQASRPELNLTNNAASGQGAWLAAGLGGTDPFCQPLPAATGGTEGSEAYGLVAGARLAVEARYFDGLGSTKASFVMWTGDTGGTTRRLESGAVCTEWHGTFTQLGVHATAADDVEVASYGVRGFAASTPGATGSGGAGFALDVLGLPGFLAGNLDVCDHPGSFGSVAFSGHTAPMFLTQAPADPGLAVFRRGAS